MIEAIYKSPFTKFTQVFAPGLIKTYFNYRAGQYDGQGNVVSILLVGVTGLQATAALLGDLDNQSPIKSQNSAQSKPFPISLVLNVVKHQLVSCLFYSALSSFGFNKHATLFASKMCVTLIYSSRYTNEYNKQNTIATIAVDAIDALMNVARFDEFPFFISFISKSIINFYVLAMGCGVQEINKKNIALILSPSIVSAMIPVDKASPMLQVLPESIASFVSSTVSAFTESGLDRAV